ncbi:MAG: sulfite exporter TauE/SafE family protein [Candidatus Limnocylindrales bacterium]
MLVLLVIVGVGFVAQLIDGSLGMGFGVLSMSLLLAIGLAPSVASATVHFAKIGTALMSGFAHWRFGNVDTRVMLLLGIPGAIGAYLGAVVLSNLSLAAARPYVSLVLLTLGVVIVARFIHGRRGARQAETAMNDTPGRARPRWLLVPLGFIGGFVDASGGGGWGPVTTSTLVASRQLSARTTIGTVNAAELAVALAASVGFIQHLGTAGVRWDVTGAILVGGLLAAIPAAWLVRHVDDRALGMAVGVLIVALSIDSVLSLLAAPEALLWVVRVAGLVLTMLLIAAALWRARSKAVTEDLERRAAAADVRTSLDRSTTPAD